MEGTQGAMRRLAGRIGHRLHPRANPSGIVFGVVAIGTLIAAEGSRRETYPDVVTASALALVLYWLVHAYARDFGDRLGDPQEGPVRRLAGALAKESALLQGGALPIVAVLLTWAAGGPLRTGSSVGLWVAGAEILALEAGAGLRRKAPAGEVLRDVALGTVLGAGLLGVRALLH